MVFSIFKSADALYDQGIDLIKQGEFDKARRILSKSIEKDGGPDHMSTVIVSMIDMRGRLGDISAYVSLLNALNGTSAEEFTFGLTTINTAMMRKQCELAIESIRTLNINDSTGALLDKGQKLIKLAQRYQSEIGDENLKLNEIYLNDTTRTGLREGILLLALGYESLSSGTVWEDPRKAAEYQQIAYGYRKQMGDSGEANLKLINDYAKTSKCWFCGRVASGLGIHFFPLSSEISPMLRSPEGSEPLASETQDFNSIYVCRACYSSINKRADEIARKYYIQAMSDMNAMEIRLQAQIASLQTQIIYARR